MPKVRSCFRMDGLNKEQQKKLRGKIKETIEKYNEEISEAELPENQKEPEAKEN